jgi:hypothetical protein
MAASSLFCCERTHEGGLPVGDGVVEDRHLLRHLEDERGDELGVRRRPEEIEDLLEALGRRIVGDGLVGLAIEVRERADLTVGQRRAVGQREDGVRAGLPPRREVQGDVVAQPDVLAARPLGLAAAAREPAEHGLAGRAEEVTAGIGLHGARL